MQTANAERIDAVAAQLEAEYTGVGWWGLIFRAPKLRRWYRLIPVKEVDADQRSVLPDWQTRPRRAGLVPVILVDQWQLDGRWFQVVCYETDATASLAQAVTDEEPGRRLAAMAAALRAYPGWSTAAGPSLVALPADIALTRHGPMLLPLPDWGPPSLAHVFAERQRLVALTPETARGRPAGPRDPGLYAMGVAARGCFEALPDAVPEQLIHQVACGRLFHERNSELRLPYWTQRVESVTRAHAAVRALTAPRSPDGVPIEALALADALDEARRALDPVTAVAAVRADGGPHPAIGLAHAALRERSDYELLLLTAEIASDDLGDPIEALALLDRAVKVDEWRTEAYARQLSLIGELWEVLRDWLADAVDSSFVQRLNATAQTAFERLPPEQARDHAHDLASCLIGQGRYADANAFVYRWLYDGSTLMWWLFDLMLDYVETFVWLDRLDAAAQMADEVRFRLRRMRESGQASRAALHRHGMRLAQLDRRILHARNGGAAS